ncbi:MFS transporter [Halorubrum sp. AJ67]|uniref:MFS transporter n=1 Tax=Halorubrum sp. AJ67 TaxID=1173487 RepID=UPI0003DC3711|nr:MFS transporter [Halorubrum sp. AJ67]CDK39044.1 major facilitator superfamily protein [Halorubrum sp. AJ67]
MSESYSASFNWSKLLTLVLIGIIPSFSGALINPTIPAIQQTFSHVPNSETLAQLVSTTSAWIVIVVAPLTGYLLDKYARKPILIAAVIIYGAGTSVAFFLDSIYLILATRILDGIAVGALMVTVPTLIADYYSGGRRESVMGYYGAVQAGGGAVAAVLGGYIAGTLGWRYIFLVFGGALLFVPPILRLLPEPDVKESQRDDEISRLEAVAKIVRESPVKVIAGIYFLVIFGMLTNNLIMIEVPYFLQDAHAVSDSQTGLIISGVMIASVVMASMYGRIKQHFRHITLVTAAFTFAAAGFLLFSSAELFPVVLVGIIVAGGMGMGLLLPTVNDWVASIVQEEVRGRALSGVTMMMYGGFALSPFAPMPLVDAFGRVGMLRTTGFLLLIVAGALVTTWFVSRSTAPPTPDGTLSDD